MDTKLVYRKAYQGYMQQCNGKSKQAIQSFTRMYQEGAKNPTQARFEMAEALRKALQESYKKNEYFLLEVPINSLKTFGRAMVEYIINPEYRAATKKFDEAYKTLYPRTSSMRETILSRRKS